MNIKEQLVEYLKPSLAVANASCLTAINAFKDGRLTEEETMHILAGLQQPIFNIKIDKVEVDNGITNWGICNSPGATQLKDR